MRRARGRLCGCMCTSPELAARCLSQASPVTTLSLSIQVMSERHKCKQPARDDAGAETDPPPSQSDDDAVSEAYDEENYELQVR